MKVPFLDLKSQLDAIRPEIEQAMKRVMDSMNFIHGKEVHQFEKNFNEIHGSKYSVGCSNGTSAISVALRALGLQSEDEVLTQTNTFFATVEAVYEVGGKVVLVDHNPKTYLIDLIDLESKISEKTKVIIPVHLYGNPTPMDEILKLAQKYNLKVIEDCAQAVCATYKGKAVGTFGDMGTMSFYPGKNLGAYGDAGMILTDHERYFKLCSMLVNHGRTDKYSHELLGGNNRMDEIQAAVLNVKLKYIKEWTKKRQSVALRYDKAFQAAGISVITSATEEKSVYHLYVVEVSNRDEVVNHLTKKEIGTGIHYPISMHNQPALKFLNHATGDFPHADRSATRILSLPMCSELTDDQVDFVISEFLSVAKK